MTIEYVKDYAGIDFRQHPELYKIGRGEQGVLIAEPYKSEIVPHWRFRTPELAAEAAAKIKALFYQYLDQGDFPGADMARKFLMMGWTRARRYANHPSGRKYATDGTVLPQAKDHATSPKAEAAKIFKAAYDEARTNQLYLRLKEEHRKLYD